MTAITIQRETSPDAASSSPASLADDLKAVAEAILDADGYGINDANVADVMPVARAAFVKCIKCIMPVVARDVLMTHRLGELADQAAKYELPPVDGAAK